MCLDMGLVVVLLAKIIQKQKSAIKDIATQGEKQDTIIKSLNTTVNIRNDVLLDDAKIKQ